MVSSTSLGKIFLGPVRQAWPGEVGNSIEVQNIHPRWVFRIKTIYTLENGTIFLDTSVSFGEVFLFHGDAADARNSRQSRSILVERIHR